MNSGLLCIIILTKEESSNAAGLASVAPIGAGVRRPDSSATDANRWLVPAVTSLLPSGVAA
jgi:hypothetical protein